MKSIAKCFGINSKKQDKQDTSFDHHNSKFCCIKTTIIIWWIDANFCFLHLEKL